MADGITKHRAEIRVGRRNIKSGVKKKIVGLNVPVSCPVAGGHWAESCSKWYEAGLGLIMFEVA